MSSNWIKMRTGLVDDPRVSGICDMTDEREATIIGALFILWAAADTHSVDGRMPGLSVKGIDRKTGVPGLGAALLAVGWITEDDQGVVITRFEDHNGASAKRRAMEAQRKARVRKPSDENPQPVRTVSASDADKKRTACGGSAELEKEREKEKDITPSVTPYGVTSPPLEKTADADTSHEGQAAKVRKVVARPDWISEQAWQDYRRMRQAKKAPLTPSAWKLLEAELQAGRHKGYCPDAMLAVAMFKGWQGFKLDWFEREQQQSGQARASPVAGKNGSSSVARRFAGTQYTGTADEDLPDELRPHH